MFFLGNARLDCISICATCSGSTHFIRYAQASGFNPELSHVCWDECVDHFNGLLIGIGDSLATLVQWGDGLFLGNARLDCISICATCSGSTHFIRFARLGD